eukprot:4813995-Amphidinium_carterae.1
MQNPRRWLGRAPSRPTLSRSDGLLQSFGSSWQGICTKRIKNNRIPIDVEFDPEAPWDGVFLEAARRQAFGDTEVRRPALALLARGSSHMLPSMSTGAADSISA